MNTPFFSGLTTGKTSSALLLRLIFLCVLLWGRAGAQGNGLVPLSGFNAHFLNPDGQNVYPCASVVTAHVDLPAGMNKVRLFFPNSFDFTALSGANPIGSTTAVPVFSFNNTSIPAGSLVYRDFTPAPGASSLEVEFRYMRCDLYNSPTVSNTGFLYFDCEGFLTAGNTTTHYLAYINHPPSGSPGLPYLGVQELAEATHAGPTINLLAGLNNTYAAYEGEEFYRTVNIEIHSASLGSFKIRFGDEPDVEEQAVCIANANSPANPTNYSLPLIPIPPSSGNGNGTFQIDLSTISPLYIITQGATRTISIAQKCKKTCLDPFNTNVSLELNCSPCFLSIPQHQTLVGQGLSLNAIHEGYTAIEYVSSELISANPSVPSSPAPPCSGDFYYDLNFNYNNGIASQLTKIIIPINTTFFFCSGSINW